MSEEIEINKIRTDGGTQTRSIVDQETVKEYRAAMADGDEFPAITVFYDGTEYWLADGFHRVAACKGFALRKYILADVRQGTQRDAILASVGANAKHGLKRTRIDKNRAVLRLLEDEEWGQWSDREIARRCHVSHPTVANMRANSTGKFTSERTYERNGKMAVMQTAKIGKGETAVDDRETAVVGKVGTNTNLITTVEIATFFDKEFPHLTDRLFVKLIRATADNPEHYLYGSPLGLYMEKHKLHGSKSLLSKLMQRVANGFEDGGVQRIHKQFLDIAQLTNHFVPFIRHNDGADINAFIAYLSGKNLNYKYDDVLLVVPSRLVDDGVGEETAVRVANGKAVSTDEGKEEDIIVNDTAVSPMPATISESSMQIAVELVSIVKKMQPPIKRICHRGVKVQAGKNNYDEVAPFWELLDKLLS